MKKDSSLWRFRMVEKVGVVDCQKGDVQGGKWPGGRGKKEEKRPQARTGGVKEKNEAWRGGLGWQEGWARKREEGEESESESEEEGLA